MKIPKALEQRMNYYMDKLDNYPKVKALYKNCCPNTVETVLEKCEDGSYFVLTGDIPAMWLRDSTAQVTHYIPLAKDPEIAEIIEGVLKRQFQYIKIDSYASDVTEDTCCEGSYRGLVSNCHL